MEIRSVTKALASFLADERGSCSWWSVIIIAVIIVITGLYKYQPIDVAKINIVYGLLLFIFFALCSEAFLGIDSQSSIYWSNIGKRMPWSLKNVYERLGRLVVGDSRSRFSLLFSARTVSGILLLIGGVIAGMVGYFVLLSSDASVTFAISFSVLLLLWERNAARTLVCVFCSREIGLSQEPGNREGKKYNRHDDDKDCFDNEKRGIAPCRGHYYGWPIPFLDEARDGKPDPHSITIGHEKLPKKNGGANRAEKSEMQRPACGPGSFGDNERGKGEDRCCAKPPKRGDKLPQRGWLERSRLLGVSGESARNGGDAEQCLFPKAVETDITAADADQGWTVAPPPAQEVSEFVEDGVQPCKKEDLGQQNHSINNVNRDALVDQKKGVEIGCKMAVKALKLTFHVVFLVLFSLWMAYYVLILPVYAAVLFFPALRSRLDCWMEMGANWKPALGFCAWMIIWGTELGAYGMVSVLLARSVMKML